MIKRKLFQQAPLSAVCVCAKVAGQCVIYTVNCESDKTDGMTPSSHPLFFLSQSFSLWVCVCLALGLILKTAKTRYPNEKFPSVNTIWSIYSEMIHHHVNINSNIYWSTYSALMNIFHE